MEESQNGWRMQIFPMWVFFFYSEKPKSEIATHWQFNIIVIYLWKNILKRNKVAAFTFTDSS